MAVPKKDKRIKLKQKKGALHIGGGRIFNAGVEYAVTADDLADLLERYPNDFEEVKAPSAKSDDPDGDPPPAA